MTDDLTIRPMRPAEAMIVLEFVTRVFTTSVAPEFSDRGVAAFMQYLGAHFLLARPPRDHFVLVATEQEVIVGAIEMRDFRHVSLFFVEQTRQGAGIGRRLLSAAIDRCLRRRPDLTEVSVHASPNAIAVYEALGFRSTAPEQEREGIRFTPMVMTIEAAP